MMRTVVLLLVLFAGTALAQDVVPEEPILGQSVLPAPDPAFPVTPVAGETQAEPFKILAIGDALGGGLGAGLTRLAEPDGKYVVTNRFNESSGIARPEVYDWTEAVAKITEAKDYDAAVILLGSNDRQDIRLGQFRYAFNTPDWIAAYKLQTDTLVDALKAQDIQVYWVSAPPMADPSYNADMSKLNDVFRERVTAKGETFVDIRPAYLGADGSYADRGPDETGAVRKLRSSDGVSFFKAGNNKMAQLVFAAIEERRKLPAGGAKPEASAPVAASALPDAPLLGQSLGAGESQTIDSKDVLLALAELAKKQTKVDADKTATPKATAPKANIIDVIAAPGTAAERLLTSGVADPAPAGRFDDFSFVAPVK
jgi:uncharacterized protein